MEKEVCELFIKEINLLRKTLDQVNPNWEIETLKEFSDNNGVLTESVCLPIRAAINYICQKEDLSVSNLKSE
jgi:hypothetical protein